MTPFEKRVKRRITGRDHLFFAVCPPGLRSLCRDEMLSVGFDRENLAVTKGGVEFSCRPDMCMQLNLNLRTPSKILMRISQFKADNFSLFEKKIKAVEWELYLPKDLNIACNVTLKKSALYHSDAVAQRTENIILQKLGSISGPENQNKKYKQTIYVRADHDIFVLSLDTSGDLLFKRGIKTEVAQAPLRETLAFAMLCWAKFSPSDILVDPMCGAGTFSLEAVMIKAKMPPGLLRHFAFESWPGFSQKTFAWLKNQKTQQMNAQVKKIFATDGKKQIFASDKDKKAVAALNKNILVSPFHQLINVSKKDFFSINPAENFPRTKGVVMLNPPYGKRIGKHDNTPAFYREVAKKLTKDFHGWKAGIIFPDRQTYFKTNLKLKLYPFSHGGFDVVGGVGII